MKNYRSIAFMAPTLLLSGFLMIPKAFPAATGAPDSPEVTRLLVNARAEAAQLKLDSTEMESFTMSTVSWKSYADKVDLIKQHVNNMGQLIGDLKVAAPGGSPWQQMAVRRIEPLLREFAANTTNTINHINENQSKLHTQEFKNYVKANAELATDLNALIRDFVSYGEAREKFEHLGGKLEISE